MRKADVTENGVNGNKLTFYKAAVPQRNVENRGEVCYSIWYVQKTKIVYFPPPVCCPSERKKGKWRRKMNLLSLLEHLSAMNKGKTIFSQIMSLIPERDFKTCVDRYKGNYRVTYISLVCT